MTWSTPADLLARLERLWQKGELLRALVVDADAQPGARPQPWSCSLKLKAPDTADLSTRFDAVRAWVQTFTTLARVRVEWRERKDRVQGRQRLPDSVWVDSLDDALALIAKTRAAQKFQGLYRQTAAAQPALLSWLTQYPLKTLELADDWPRLIAVVDWMQAHPRPGIYLRQVDAPGIDSKFIESHRATLAAWLDLALPAAAIDPSATGVGQFARRYGLRDKPVRIRARWLDPRLPQLPGCAGLSDLTLDADSFAALQLPATRVFITENEVNFLAFPPVADAIVIFGAGYGWEALARAPWLQRVAMHYWGDIDTHGFAILDSLRAHFPQAQSLLMDRATLAAHQPQWGEEPEHKRCARALSRLTDTEAQLFDDLRADRIALHLRLEQERIGYGWLCRALAGLLAQNAV